MVTVHATCIAFDGRGVLLRGPSGSGKSDLALRAIDAGARLVADDRVALSRRGADLFAAAPPELFGLLEVRGLGIVRLDADAETPVALVADLKPAETIERMPEACRCELMGVALPCLALAPFELSAVAKLRLALATASQGAELLLQ